MSKEEFLSFCYSNGFKIIGAKIIDGRCETTLLYFYDSEEIADDMIEKITQFAEKSGLSCDVSYGIECHVLNIETDLDEITLILSEKIVY